MKMTDNKRYTIYLILIFAASLTFFFLISAAIKAVPNSVTYTLYTEKQAAEGVRHIPEELPSCSYDSIYKVTEKGPFEIIAKDENIFVFYKDVCLYRVKAELSRFPDADKSTIISGITADNRQDLLEIIEYMES